MTMSFNANVLPHISPQLGAPAPVSVDVASMGQEAEMERRRRRACKHGRTKAGRCRKRPR